MSTVNRLDLINYLNNRDAVDDNQLVSLVADWLSSRASTLELNGSKHDVYDAVHYLRHAVGVEPDEEDQEEPVDDE